MTYEAGRWVKYGVRWLKYGVRWAMYGDGWPMYGVSTGLSRRGLGRQGCTGLGKDAR
jgi:hypothetical protein